MPGEVKNIEAKDGKNVTDILIANINQVSRELNNISTRIFNNQTNLLPNNNYLNRLDGFEKGILQFESAINSKYSLTILKGMYDGLNSEYYQLQNLIQQQSTWYSVLFNLNGKLQVLYNRMMTQS